METPLKRNAAGLVVAGDKNPNWRGGPLQKICIQCGIEYQVPISREKSRFCSMRCVGKSQKGIATGRPGNSGKNPKPSRMVTKLCLECGSEYKVPPSVVHRHFCCSRKCQGRRRAKLQSGPNNPNWNDGVSLLPYPFEWREIREAIKQRDGYECFGLECRRVDTRIVVHHIDYDKNNCDERNLITLCSSCNTIANFDRPQWMEAYQELMRMMFPELFDE